MRTTAVTAILSVFCAVMLGDGTPCWAVPGPDHAEEQAPVLAGENRVHIKFTSHEGTWMSVDVDRRSEVAVFDLLGDLYNVDLAGGPAQRLTSGPAFDSIPRLSPDGRWLAFVSDRSGGNELWVLDRENGALRQVSSLGSNLKLPNRELLGPHSLSWFNDSCRILVGYYDVQAVLWKASEFPVCTQGEPRPIDTGDERISVRDPVPTPDGSHVYFSDGTQIHKLSLATHRVEQVTNVQTGSAFRPQISPNGTLLSYVTSRPSEDTFDLRVRNIQTGADTDIAKMPSVIDYAFQNMRGQYPAYAFTHDDELAIAAGARLTRVSLTSKAVTSIPFVVDVDLEVTPRLDFPRRLDDGPVKLTVAMDPALSPNGRSVAFSAGARVYVAELATGKTRPLSHAQGGGQYKPAWSPDGKWVAFVSWSREGGHIWRVSAKGGMPERLSPYPAFYTGLVYSPDGSRIFGLSGNAHVRRSNHKFELFSRDVFKTRGSLLLSLISLPADGGKIERILSVDGLAHPHFGKHSDRIYLNALNFDSPPELISMKLDGTDVKTEAAVISPGATADHEESPITISPDGRWLLIKNMGQLYVSELPVDPVDKIPRTIDLSDPDARLHRLTDIGVDYAGWAIGGQTIFWSLGPSIFRTPFSGVTERKNEFGAVVKALPREAEVGSVKLDLEFDRDLPNGVLVLENATIITMGEGEKPFVGDILICNNRIADVGAPGTINVPQGTRRIDVSGKYILPGFVDTHSHLITSFAKKNGVLQAQDWAPMAALAYGVTTAVEVQSVHVSELGYRDLSEMGVMVGPRLIMTGPGIVGGGRGYSSFLETLYALRRYKDYYGVHYIKAYEVGDRKQHQWVAQAAHRLQLMATAHPRVTRPFDGFSAHEHQIGSQPFGDDVVKLFARTNTGYSTTFAGTGSAVGYFVDKFGLHDSPKLNYFTPGLDELVSIDSLGRLPSEYYRFNQLAEGAASILRNGGTVGVGSHSNIPGLMYHIELFTLATAMTPDEVMRSATINGAKMIGLSQDIGSLEKGKLADLLILDNNPLESVDNVSSIRFVMKNGRLYDASNLNEIWPTPRQSVRFNWKDD